MNEIERFVEKMLHHEFLKYIENDLSREYVENESLQDKERLNSLLITILSRFKSPAFVELFKEETIICIKFALKKTIINYISKMDDKVTDEAYSK